jgi:V/A-type H+/Na+-transporting ATPase subunit E
VAAQTLLREVEGKRKRILEQLDSEQAAKKEEIRKKVEQERSAILESAGRQADELSQRERIRIEGAGKLRAKRLIFDATEKMLESKIAALKQALAEFARSEEYSDLLPRMVRYASKRLAGEIGVICRPSDGPLLKELGVDLISSNLNSIGGLIAQRKDGTLELDLTFEEILRNREEQVRVLIQSKE